MYTFCSEFHILVSNIFWNFIIFLILEEITLRCRNPRSFLSDHISLYIIIIPLEASQNSFLFECIFYRRKIINNSSLLTGLSNQHSLGCILIPTLLYF